jgi:Carboxypeptidase regulatory-like domain
MRSSRVLLSILALILGAETGLSPWQSSFCRGCLCGASPTSYYASAYYPSAYYATAYYPTYYATAYYPTYYSSAFYSPTAYYSSAYYYPTYYSSAYYYYPTAYYATGYYLGSSSIDGAAARSGTRIATTNPRQGADRERSVDRRMVASTARGDDSMTYKATQETGASDAGAAATSSLVRRTTYRTSANSSRGDAPLSPERQTRRNVLLGRVETDAGEARDGVQVTVSSRTERGLARSGVSDAFGRFAIRLDDGEWTVRVTMPSGRVYAVKQLTVHNGQIVDDEEGRNVPSLIISF